MDSIQTTPDTQSAPLVILALDAGDPGFIQQWAQEGHLPTIASIMERGCWGRTTGPELISEHGVWLSLFSGISRGQHGYYYYRQLTPGTYDLESVAGPDIGAIPFWSYCRGQGRKLAIIDVSDSEPIPGLPGIQLTNWHVHDTWNPEYATMASEPPELVQEVERLFGPKLAPLEQHNSSFEEDLRIRDQLLDRIKRKGELCRHLLSRDRFDLSVIMFSESHSAGHQFWQYHPRNQKAGAAENELTHAMRDVYQAIDREWGSLLEQLPQSANVIITSSVGLEDDYPINGLADAFFHQLGYQVPTESKGISMRPLDVARRLLPEAWRVALSRHLPREKREQLMADQFRNGTNWGKTTAFSIPSPYTTFVRVNLRGREPQGIVEPGAEYEALLQRIETDLRQLVDPQTGKPAVTSIVRTIDLFGGSYHHSLPDLFVEWKPGRYMDRVVHPNAELVQKKPEFFRRSDHVASGFVATAGPSIRARGTVNDIPLLNLAPTFLSLLGESLPQQMSGEVLHNIIHSEAARSKVPLPAEAGV